jgi:hypothetical protein
MDESAGGFVAWISVTICLIRLDMEVNQYPQIGKMPEADH